MISNVTRVLLLTALAACSTRGESATPPAAAGTRATLGEPLTLQFRWPVPVTAVVEATSVRAEATVKSRYSATLDTNEDGLLILSFADFGIVEINGIVPNDFDTVSANMASVAKLAAIMPSIRVERSGMSGGLVDGDEALAQMIVTRAEHDPIVAELLLAKLADPLTFKVFEHQHARPWRHWVESWLGLELVPTDDGYQVVVPPEVEKRHGVGVREITARARGDDPAVLELEKKFRIDGEAGRELINTGLEPVFGLLGIPEMVEVQELEVEATITAVMDIRTLQPEHVESRLSAHARTETGVIDHEQLDTYDIQWLAPGEPVPPMLEELL